MKSNLSSVSDPSVEMSGGSRLLDPNPELLKGKNMVPGSWTKPKMAHGFLR